MTHFVNVNICADRQKKEERRTTLSEDEHEKERKRKAATISKDDQSKRLRSDGASASEISSYVDSSEKTSPTGSMVEASDSVKQDDSSNEDLVVDCESPSTSSSQSMISIFFIYLYVHCAWIKIALKYAKRVLRKDISVLRVHQSCPVLHHITYLTISSLKKYKFQ